MLTVLKVLIASLLLVMGAAQPPRGAPAGRVGDGPGALGDPVYFVVSEISPYHGDSYILPISDPAQLREARDVINGRNGLATIAVCQITIGSDGINRDVLAPGEPLWSWHVIGFGGFAENTQETLDGWPGLVEANPYAYIQPPPEGDNTGAIGFWTYTVTQELGPGPGISPPTTPGALSLSALGGGQVRLTWTDRSNNEEGFEIQRQQKVGSFWMNSTLIPLPPNTTTYTDTPGAGTFQYRVRSWNIGGSSAWTNWKSIKAR